MDFANLGFKCGIEIHNRLATKHKLFCKCPPHFGEKVTSVLNRKLRSVSGEMGGVDPAVMHEYLRDRNFIYDVYENTCLVEMDEEPPHDFNSEALLTGLQVTMMLNAKIPHEVHTMRKTVIDGSNTSGFQRTAIIGRNGVLETSRGPVRIANINIEEESAGIVERKGRDIIYRLDRLGIPLIEIGTDPDVKDPEHAYEVAAKLGMLIRSTGKSQRGIGSIRQDVNISIARGARVEIKGVQELGMLKEFIEKEILRQVGLLKISEELKKRNAAVEEVKDVTELFKWSSNKIVKDSVKSGERVYAFVARGFGGIMKQQLHEGKYFAKELVDYGRAFGVPGFFHSDEDISKYNLEDEFRTLRERNRCEAQDAVIVLAGNQKAILAIAERCKVAIKEVPKETRVANPDGSSSFTRPLPGSSRMYPETDIVPIFLNSKELAEIEKTLPETWERRLVKYKKIISDDLAKQILTSEYLPLFERLYKKYDPNLVAGTLTSTIKSLERDGFNTARVLDHHFEELFDAESKELTAKESIPEVLKYFCGEGAEGKSVKDAIEKLGLKSMTKDELRKLVEYIFDKNQELVQQKREGALMGIIMKEVRGRADGKLIAQTVHEMLNPKS